MNPKNYTSDHVSKAELRKWCEEQTKGVVTNALVAKILEKFCEGEK